MSYALDGHKWIRYMLSFIREEGGSLCSGKQVGVGVVQWVRVRAVSNDRGPEARPDRGQIPDRISPWSLI